MTDLGPGSTFVFWRGYANGWDKQFDLPTSSIDELGHVTAGFYPQVFEDAAYSFLTSVAQREWPDYVVARMLITYRREVVLQRSPVTVYVAVDSVGHSSFDLTMVLVDIDGTACTQAEVHYVAWDRRTRRRRDLAQHESEALVGQIEKQASRAPFQGEK